MKFGIILCLIVLITIYGSYAQDMASNEFGSVNLCIRYMHNITPEKDPSNLKNICEEINNDAEERIDISLSDVLAYKINTFNISSSKKLNELDNISKAKIAQLDTDKIEFLSSLEPLGLEKITTLDIYRINKLSRLDITELQKVTSLDEDELLRLTELPFKDIVRFSAYDLKYLEKIANLDRVTLNRISFMEDEEIKSELDKYIIRKKDINKIYLGNKNETYISQLNKEEKDILMHSAELMRQIREQNDRYRQTKNISHLRNSTSLLIDLILNNINIAKIETERSNIITNKRNILLRNLDKEKKAFLELKNKSFEENSTLQLSATIKNLSIEWKETKSIIIINRLALLEYQIDDLITQSRIIEKILDESILKLEEDGYDVYEENMAVTNYSIRISEIDAQFNYISSGMLQYNKTDIEKINKNLTTIYSDLRDSHNDIKPLIRNIIDIAGNHNVIESYDADIELLIQP